MKSECEESLYFLEQQQIVSGELDSVAEILEQELSEPRENK